MVQGAVLQKKSQKRTLVTFPRNKKRPFRNLPYKFQVVQVIQAECRSLAQRRKRPKEKKAKRNISNVPETLKEQG